MKYFIGLIFCCLLFSCESDTNSFGETSGQGTQSGSYANMLSVSGFLYVVSDNELITYSLLDPSDPIEISRQELGFGIESIFHRSGILFIGSRESLHIYKIETNGIPFELSETNYTALGMNGPCDPVVTNDSIAYVSLSSRLDNIDCGQSNVNEIRFYNILDLQNPILVNRLDMESPKGLGLDKNILFVCEETNGLKILDVSNVFQPIQLYHFNGFKTTDVITLNGLLLVVGPEELYEFDYHDLSDVKLLSTIDL